MSRLCRFFLILIAACTAVGCSSPVGSIGGSGAPDLFWAVPCRIAYNTGDRLMPDSDLRVFASYRGVVESVPLKQVKIGIAGNPERPDILIYFSPDKWYPLENKGRKIVVVEYGEVSASYSIEVSDAPKGEVGSGIIIEWAE
jgi:hypothetical protein